MPKEPRAAGMKRKERERQAEELIFSKVLSPVDVGRLDQLVIPKQHAERLFQLDAAAANDKDGEDPEYIFEDRAGKPWRFRCSYWNLMRYILTKEWGDFVKEKCLDAGDTVSFYRSAGAGKAAGEGQGRLLIDYTRKGDCKKDLHLRLHPDPDPAPRIPKQPVESDSFSISILQLPKHPVQQSDSFLQPFPRAPPRPPSQLPLATPTARIELTDPYSPFHLQSSIRRLFQQLVHVRNTNTSSCSWPPNAQAPLSDAWYQTLKYLTCNAQECLQYVYYKMVLTIHGNGESHKKEWSKVSANSSKMTSTTTSPSQFHCGEELRILSTIETLEGSIHHIREICGANLNNCRIMVSLSPSIMYCILLCRGILGIMSISGAEDTNEKQELPVFAFDDLSCHDKVTRVKAQRIPAGVTEPIYLLLTAIRHLLYLDLSGCNGLTQLPASLGTLHNLAALNLSCCSSLHILPPSVGSLQNLQILVLSCCQKLKNLPESICESSKLRLLDLSGCSSLETLPDSFVNLGHLEILNLSECKRLKQLPQPFGNLQGLKSMNLSGCHGVDLDVECVSKLANLKYLTLSTHTSTQCFSYSFRHLGNWLDMSRWWRKNRIHLHCGPKAAVLHLYTSHEQSIINKLLCHGSDNDDATADQIVTSICIVGESGMGKSELVHQIYNDQMILEAFDLRIWVYMCDKKRLLGKIVEFTTCSHYSSDAPITVLEEIVIEELTGKRLLLVLDDCDVKMSQYFWNDLRILLNVCAKGSALIVTTKSKEVANLVGAMQTYHLSSLSKEECFMIFKGHVLSGLDVNFNAELESVAWKIVEKCGGNALCVKALSGLFCHSEIGFSEIDMLGGGILPALRLCYNLLPAHLQQCFKFCSLFPRDYIFIRNHIIRLWIAQGFVFPEESSQPEDIGLHYFDELFCRSFFQRSPFHNDQEDKFVMHELFHDLALSFSKDECFRCEKPFCSLPENISHLSLVLSDFRTVAPSMEVRNLQSFLVVRRSFPVVKIFGLDDLCLKSRFLRSLDLSYTDILELPSSIRNMKHLRLLALNNTKINGLPFEIGQVTTLQTLELKECCHLINLPRSISSLTNLRHLDVRKEQGNVQVGMPHGIGQLTDLQTLAVFYVGNNLLHCSIGELKNLNGLRGHVHITGLENIEKADGAREANIANKHFLQALTLEWSYSDEDMDDDLGKEIGYVILQNLQPNSKLQQLIIRNYPSDLFPVWMQDSYLCKLVSVTLDNCHECNELPCLGDLPSLKNLFIQRMNLIESFGINRNSLATERIYSPRFPSLEVLTLSEMYSLQFWVGTSEGDYPRLCRLSISRCPKLISLPRLNSLVHLSFHFGGPVLPSFSELPLLASLKIEGFQKINFISFPRQIKTLRKLEISDCKELLSVYAYSLSVSELQVVRCPKLDFVGNLMEDRLEQLAVGSRNSSTRRRSIVLKVMTYTDLHDDGWNWKIYHEKNISGSKFSRSYYRCINSGCSATKILQPNDNDPNTLSAMYISDHNHLSQENTPQTV